MENNTIDIDDETSECEELILKSRIIGYESENESDLNESDLNDSGLNDIDEFDDTEIETLEEMIILEISLTHEDFNLLKENKIIIGNGEDCILILNDLIKNCKDKNLEDNLDKDKFKFLYGFIMGLIYSKHIKK